ncbi:MAG: DUF3443 family protein [bacterium]
MKSGRIRFKGSLRGNRITLSILNAFILLSIALLTLGVRRANAQADLVEISVSNPPATTTEKARFWVTDTVKNEGTDTAPPSTTQYYFSTTGSMDAGSILLSGKRSVPSLNAGKSSRGMAAVTVPLTTPTGVYYLLACADNTDVVPETNNCISSAKTTNLTAPDLVETSVTDPPSSESGGDSFPVTDTVQNQGNRKAAASVTRYYLSSTGVKDAGAVLLTGSRSIPGLAPGATSKGTVTVKIPFNTPDGIYYLLACADDTNKVAESNETNNCIASSTQVTSYYTANVLSITVNGSLCSAATSSSYPNKPCVSVTVCSPGSTTDCQIIDDILLDTGSSGLRIFKQVLTVSLTQETIDSHALAECIQYGDGSSDWGPVKMASIILGNEPAVQVPIQVINQTFGTPPEPCQGQYPDTSPAEAGFNGILGVSFFAQDCGSECVDPNTNYMYYTCNGTSCTLTAAPLSNQVPNPVALLPEDNNGVIVELPDVPTGGSVSVNGQLLLGIGNHSNNIPSPGVTAYAADDNPADYNYGEFLTTFSGTPLYSFLDTGSNGLFFPALSSLPDCGSYNSGWFCPSSLVDLSATNEGASGSPSGAVSFQIGNCDSLFSSSNMVFPDIGGDCPGEFDWGIPFHLGKNVYVGIENMSSTLGTGPYWAY